MSIGILGEYQLWQLLLWEILCQIYLARICRPIEAFASRLGLSVPDFTPKQVGTWQIRVSRYMAKLLV